jgi:hypothetical protein
MKKIQVFVFSLLTVLLVSACSPASGILAEEAASARAWFDAPLPNSNFPPPDPCQIVAHGASPNGIAVFELSINGAVSANVPSPDTQSSLVTLTQDCGLSEPGNYLLQMRAQDNAGEWSGYAETNLIIPDSDETPTATPLAPEPTVTGTSTLTGNIGGAVFADQNGNGLQDSEEGPLDSVDVILKGCGLDATQTTDPDGTFQFANVPAGSCTLEVFKAGWGFSGSSPSLAYPLPVASDPNLPTNVGILMAPMSDNLPDPNFGVPQLSGSLVYYGGARCDPNRVTVQIKAQHPDGIKVMVFFHKLRELNGSKDSGWFEGFSMNTGGDGLYSLAMSADRLVGKSGFNAQAIVSYQFVMQTQKDEFVRSAVYSDLYLSPCGSSPPPAVTTTPGIIFPPIIITTPTAPIPH